MTTLAHDPATGDDIVQDQARPGGIGTRSILDGPGDDWQELRRWREGAGVGDAGQLVTEPKLEQDLGSRREKGDDAHVPSLRAMRRRTAKRPRRYLRGRA